MHHWPSKERSEKHEKYGPVFSYKLRLYIYDYIGLVEIAISTNLKATIYRNLYEKTVSDSLISQSYQLSLGIYHNIDEYHSNFIDLIHRVST